MRAPERRIGCFARPASTRKPNIAARGSKATARDTASAPAKRITFTSARIPPSRFTLDIYRTGLLRRRRRRHVHDLGPLRRSHAARPAGRPEAAARLPLGSHAPRFDDPARLAQRRLSRQAHRRAATACRATSSSSCATIAAPTSCSSARDTTWQAYNRWPSQFSLYDDGKKRMVLGPGRRQSASTGPTASTARSSTRRSPPAPANVPLGISARLLDGAAGLRRHLHLESRHPRRPAPACCGRRDFSPSATTSTGRSKCSTTCGGDRRRPERRLPLRQHRLRPDRSLRQHSRRPQAIGVIERVGVFGPRDAEEVKTSPTWIASHERARTKTCSWARAAPARSPAAPTGSAPCPTTGSSQGTGMKDGDGIPGLVGWEWHGDPAQIPGLEIVATGPTQQPGKPHGSITPPRSIPAQSATSSSTPRPAGGPTACPNRPATSVRRLHHSSRPRPPRSTHHPQHPWTHETR